MVVRRFEKFAVSFCLVLALGVTRVNPLFAQADAKKDTPPPKAGAPATKETPKTDTAKPAPAKKDESAKSEATKATEPPLPPIPPEVQAKIEAAQGRRRGHRGRPGRGPG